MIEANDTHSMMMQFGSEGPEQLTLVSGAEYENSITHLRQFAHIDTLGNRNLGKSGSDDDFAELRCSARHDRERERRKDLASRWLTLLCALHSHIIASP
jgi:hypothetical protein